MSYWMKYKQLFHQVIRYEDNISLFKIDIWRVNLFRETLIYGLPVSLIAIIPLLVTEIEGGKILFPIFNIVFIMSFMGLVLNRKIELDYKMVFVVAILYVVAVIYLFFVGAEGPGSIYLLMITVFSAMIFPERMAYVSLLINILICVGIGLILKFNLFPTPLSDSYDLSLWLAYSGNLIFVSFISILMITNVLNGFEKTIAKEGVLVKKLDASEKHYRNVFDSNPVPMYIFELKTGNFLKVNEAAVEKYGYSLEEFMKMNIADIRPTDEISKLMDIFSTVRTREYTGLITHKNKKGDLFPVEIDTNIVTVDGVEARLVLSTDVSERLNYVRMIERQNQDLKDIAWIQSHMVRAPLTNIMSLTELMLQDPQSDQTDMLMMLKDSTDKLNEAIESIVKQAEQNQVTTNEKQHS